MAYLEIWKKGELVNQKIVGDDQAKKGCRVRLGSADPVILKMGESKSQGKYYLRLIAEDQQDAKDIPGRPNLELSQTEHGDNKSDSVGFSPDKRYPKIEGYEITGLLGAGGMGAVYRATQLSTNRKVALKLLKGQALNSAKSQVRFEREVNLTARIKHPNIAKIYDSGSYRGVCYYAMDLIDGVHLDRYAKKRSLTQEQILELFRRICRALNHAHKKGIIHRDIKPSNILVTNNGQPHILDFGLAKTFLEGDSGMTISVEGEIAGTPAYMAPEQARGNIEELDTRTDVYSLGIILYRLLTGNSPHELTGSRYEIIKRIAENEVLPPSEFSKDIDPQLERLLLRALARDPDDRYLSAGDMADDIESFLCGELVIDEVITKNKSVSIVFHKLMFRKHYIKPIAVFVFVAMLTIAILFFVITGERRKRIEAEELVSQLKTTLSANSDKEITQIQKTPDTVTSPPVKVDNEPDVHDQGKILAEEPSSLEPVPLDTEKNSAIVNQWAISDGGNGHYYMPVHAPEGISWTQAKEACEQAGGYLVTITSEEENELVVNLVDDEKYWHQLSESNNHGPWIGGMRTVSSSKPDDGWGWITDEPFTYVNWFEGEPTGGVWLGKKENRLQLSSSKGSRRGTWNDIPDELPNNYAVYGYIIEFDSKPAGLWSISDGSKSGESFDELPGRNDSPVSLENNNIGKWVRLPQSRQQLDKWRLKKEVTVRNGMFSLSGSTGLSHKTDAKNIVIRAKVRKVQGQNLMLMVRANREGYYSAWYNGGGWFGIGKNIANEFIDIEMVTINNFPEVFFEMQFAAIDEVLILYVNRKETLRVRDQDIDSGVWVAFTVYKEALGQFKDIEILVPSKAQEEQILNSKENEFPLYGTASASDIAHADIDSPLVFDGRPKILFDEAHSNRNSLSLEQAELSNPEHPDWAYCGILKKMLLEKYEFEHNMYHTFTEEMLNQYQVVIISTANKGFHSTEVKALQSYVMNGGNVFAWGDSGLRQLNKFLQPTGIAIKGDTLFADEKIGSHANFVVTKFANHPATPVGSKYRMNWGGFMEINPPAKIMASTGPNAWRETNGNRKKDDNETFGRYPVMAISKVGKGCVIVITDNAFHDDYLKDPGTKNGQLFMSVLDWLVKRAAAKQRNK